MAKFKVYFDEKVTMWQRIEVLIECEDQAQLEALASDHTAFSSYLDHDNILDISTIDTYPETIDHLEYDFNNVNFDIVGGN